jgi:glycosyltransferase involved in cell wall biosynthesis
LETALDAMGHPYEIIYVDDASSDGSWEKLQQLATTHPRLRTIRHRRNFGQSAAIFNGYRISRGRFIVTMDADLQADPADIPRLYELVQKAHAVCGVRQGRRDGFVKKVSSRIANGLRGMVLRDGIHDAGCTYRIVRRSLVQNLPPFRALHRFLPSILRFYGLKVIEAPVRHRPRVSGVSKYGIGNRAWVGIIDMMAMRWYRHRHLPPNMLDSEGD